MYRTISFCGETRRCGMNEEVRDDGVAAGDRYVAPAPGPDYDNGLGGEDHCWRLSRASAGETPAGGVNILL